MAENITTSSTDADNKNRRRKALLAGGLVLGLGAAVTLAAWSDNVFASGTFNTATFELQGATDNATFQDYDEAPGAELSFELNAAQMSPNQTVYAPFTVATSTDTDVPGTFTLTNITNNAGGLEGVLTYSIYAVEGDGAVANCSPDNPPTTAATWTGAATAATPSTTSTLNVGANQNVPRQALCFAVTMGDQAAVEAAMANDPTPDSHQTTITWQFTGESTEQQ